MSLIWADGFDHYGTSTTFLSQMGYAAISAVSVGSNSASARTGTGYIGISNGICYIKRALTVAQDTIGQGIGYYLTACNTSNQNQLGLCFGDAGEESRYKAIVNANLGISIYRGTTLLGSSDNNVFSLNSYFWLEVKLVRNSGTSLGTIEARIDGNSVVTVTGVSMLLSIATCILGNSNGSHNCGGRFDDWVIWDGNGTRNNDFLGDRRCATSFPDADTVEADWAKSTGTSGFALIDNNPPVDTQYIEANTVGDISEFEKTPLGITTNDIAGVCLVPRAAKSDAGVSTYRVGINSAGFVQNSDAISPGATPAFAYSPYIVEVDPATGVPFTRATYDAALLRLTRES